MTFFVNQIGSLLAADEPSRALKAIEFDFPESTWGWALLILGPLLLVAWMIFVNIVDTKALWRRSKAAFLATGWLILLRLAVIAGVIVIALNPQERTRTTAFRRSRVAMVADTSLSLRYPEEDAPAAAGSVNSSSRSRADAIADLLSKTPLLDRLRTRHDVSLYTFDSALSPQPFAILYENSISTTPQPKDGEQSTEAATTAKAPAPQAGSGPIDWQEVLRPRGIETRLGEAVLTAIRDLNGQTLSGIGVLSDGGSNSGIDPATAHDAARNAKPSVRLVTVGVGGTAQPLNLHIASIRAPTDAHVGDAYDFSAFVQGEGLAGRTVQVELFMKPEGTNEQPVAAESSDEFPNPREITLREDGTPVEVKYVRRPTVPGTVEYFVRAKVKGEARELSMDDNERRKTIRVTDRKTRVLLLAGGPTRDYRFVRNLLFRHKGFDIDVLLQTVEPDTIARVSQESSNLLIEFPKTAAELFEYDVVIAFDPDWARLSIEQIKFFNEWVGTHAGGLIVMAGDVYTPELAAASDQFNPIRELYPVFLSSFLLNSRNDSSTSQAWPINWTQAGTNAGFLQLEEEGESTGNAWKQFPGVYRCYPTGGARAGATVYGLFSDPRTQSEYGLPVLLATQYYGAGRVMYIGSPEIWRLRTMDSKYYDRFWTKTAREVAEGRMQRGNSRGTLLLERTQYVLGQTVRLRASLLTPQLGPYRAELIRAEVYEPSGKPTIPPRILLPDKNAPGQFVGDFRANLPGTYKVEVTIPETKETLSAKIDVVLPSLESDDPRQNVKLLNDLARDTGGRYIPLHDLAAMFVDSSQLTRSRELAEQKGDAAEVTRLTAQLDAANSKVDTQLAELFPNRGEEFTVDERLRTLWDRDWVLYALIGLLSLEWLTRKLLKLA